MVELIQDLAGPARQNSFPDYFGISKLHRKIINSGGGGKSGPWRKEERTVVNKRDLLDWTPLHYAAARQNELLGYDLLKRGADPNLKDLHGFTPVHYASEHGMKSFVSLLQRFGGRLDARGLNGATPMHVAARGGHLKLIKSWSRYDQGDIQSLSRLRDHNGRVPVHWAVVYGQEKVVEELRSSLDEPDKYGWTSLHLATVHHDDRLMETVLGLSTEREKLDRKGRTALILACEKERLQAAHQLIEAGADVNAATPDGTTVLNYAIIYTGDVSLVRALVRQGAKVDVPSKAFEGRTPLHSAAERGNFPIVSILVGSLNSLGREARSLAIDFGDQDGLTALHLAVQNRYPKVMTLLLSAGADPNKQDKEQQTPLHRVFTMGWERRGMCLTLVKMLIENGANPRARDQFGSMPSDIATQLRYLESAEYLGGYTGVDET
ncbi:hypothetical protein NW754_004675 [Fusarium falciforme]|nr:hypothetical protein NW754_004675 [Fusarium falciforme]